MPGDTAGVRCVLLVVPYLGGGTTRHVREMAAAWSAQGLRVLLLETQGRLVELDLYETGEAVRRLLFPYDEAFLLEMLRGSGVELVHYHHVYTLYPPLMQLPAALGVLILIVAGYQTWNTFVAIANPQDVIVDDDSISFCAFGRTDRYAFEDIKSFNVREVGGDAKVYVRVNGGGLLRGRYWLQILYTSDGKELFQWMEDFEYRVEPDSLKARARRASELSAATSGKAPSKKNNKRRKK